MRLILISDTHNKHRDIIVPSGDVLIVSGDITILGSKARIASFNAWLATQPHLLKIVVPGNHDVLFAKDYRKASAALSCAVCLLDQGLTYRGFNFYGTPWGSKPNVLAFAGAPPRGWESIPADTDILITHTPPYGILDVSWAGNNVGNKGLGERLRYLPDLKLHVFGHVHESAGKLTYNDTLFVNASVLDSRYRVAGEATVIDL